MERPLADICFMCVMMSTRLMSMRRDVRRALGAGATLGALLAPLACEAPTPRDPPVGVSRPAPAPGPAVPAAPAAPAARPDTFPSARGLPPAPPESLLGAPAGRARAPAAGSKKRTTAAQRTPPPRAAGAGRRRACVVERVHDGDTLRCRDRTSVRLLLIDAPETDQRPFGDRSRRQLAALVPPGTSVELETDAEPRDRYGRLLAYVYAPDGRMANEEMVRAGYALVLHYKPNGRHLARFEAAAAAARAAGLGLHGEGGFACEPRAHRQKRC